MVNQNSAPRPTVLKFFPSIVPRCSPGSAAPALVGRRAGARSRGEAAGQALPALPWIPRPAPLGPSPGLPREPGEGAAAPPPQARRQSRPFLLSAARRPPGVPASVSGPRLKLACPITEKNLIQRRFPTF